ncbi:toxin-antitoxin system HicB family antitoxin [Polymorphospora sp. NPDC050346]|uniref:toxin-antitoxin system HicB family antitoxin n=1 Tax=Polymorphospora sp. NPDC050346 TaxID=3155780 RepID=UPI0033D00648
MDLTPYLDNLRRDLAATAAPGGAEISRAAELLAGSLEPSARLCLLDALSDAADEITTQLSGAGVEVRLRGRQAEFVVTETQPASAPAPQPPPVDTGGDVSRITLRLPEALKDAVERTAAAEGVSVNAWLVRAVAGAVHTGHTGPPSSHRSGRRITGFAQA